MLADYLNLGSKEPGDEEDGDDKEAEGEDGGQEEQQDNGGKEKGSSSGEGGTPKKKKTTRAAFLRESSKVPLEATAQSRTDHLQEWAKFHHDQEVAKLQRQAEVAKKKEEKAAKEQQKAAEEVRREDEKAGLLNQQRAVAVVVMKDSGWLPAIFDLDKDLTTKTKIVAFAKGQSLHLKEWRDMDLQHGHCQGLHGAASGVPHQGSDRGLS